jgi:hypothetical protein
MSRAEKLTVAAFAAYRSEVPQLSQPQLADLDRERVAPQSFYRSATGVPVIHRFRFRPDPSSSRQIRVVVSTDQKRLGWPEASVDSSRWQRGNGRQHRPTTKPTGHSDLE